MITVKLCLGDKSAFILVGEYTEGLVFKLAGDGVNWRLR